MRRFDSIYKKTWPPPPLIHAEEIPSDEEIEKIPSIEVKSGPQVEPKFLHFYKTLRIFILIAIAVLLTTLIYPWSNYLAKKKSGSALQVAGESQAAVASAATTPVSQESFFYYKKGDMEIKAPIVAGIDEKALKQGIGHHNDSVWPDTQGNVVLAGHSFSLDPENAYGLVFARLRDVTVGDQVMIYDRGKNFYYKVFNRKVVSASDITLFSKSDKWMLTFYTCDPPKTDWQRLVFQAELVKVE